jgi:peroxiredoxin (alkyl hydroperoxide reductase subunit C)
MLSAVVFAQNVSRIPLIGEEAPKFKANSTKGVINFPKDFGTNWKLIVSHPQDFTSVCTTELIELAAMQEELKKMNVDIIVVSTDTLYQHHNWIEWMEKLDYKDRGPVKIDFPLVEDINMKVSQKYGMLHENVSTTKDVRGVFIIDPKNVIRMLQFYPMQVGRNMEEIKRTIIALQTSDYEDVSTPANWKPGEDVLLHWYDAKVLADPAVYQLNWFLTFRKQ